jgi:cell division protease FtsH
VTKFPTWLPLLFLLAVVYLALLLGSVRLGPPSPVEVPYSQFKSFAANGKVAEVVLEDHGVRGTLVDAEARSDGQRPVQMFETRIPQDGDPELLPTLEKTGVVVHVREEKRGIAPSLIYLLPWILIIAFWIWMLRRMYGNLPGGMG